MLTFDLRQNPIFLQEKWPCRSKVNLCSSRSTPFFRRKKSRRSKVTTFHGRWWPLIYLKRLFLRKRFRKKKKKHAAQRSTYAAQRSPPDVFFFQNFIWYYKFQENSCADQRSPPTLVVVVVVVVVGVPFSFLGPPPCHEILKSTVLGVSGPGGQGSNIYVLCAEPKEHKHFLPSTVLGVPGQEDRWPGWPTNCVCAKCSCAFSGT